MKITVKKTKTVKNLWEDAHYPLVCKHKDGMVGIAVDSCRGTIIHHDAGEVTTEGSNSCLSWEKAGFVPCTEPVTITFEN